MADQPQSSLFSMKRRHFLRWGGVTVAATAAQLMGWRTPTAFADPTPADDATADQLLFLWLPGGVTQLESFDPKPEAPREIRGPITAIETSVPGVHFAEVMPRLARQMQHLALVRTYAAGTADHFEGQCYALSGKNVLPNGILSEPNFGCFVSKFRGESGGLPGYIAVPGSTRPGEPYTNEFVAAYLGEQYAPFCTMGEPRQPDFQIRDLAWLDGLSTQRLATRMTLRQQLETTLTQLEASQATDRLEQTYGKAVDLLTSSSVRAAFDVHQESAETKLRYGMSKVGQRCLLARRLIEANARCVMMDYGYDWGEYDNLWDNHCVPTQNQPHIWEMCKVAHHLPAVDQAFAALLEDLAESGRLDRTLVVYLTEFGRTPQINQFGGREHWAHSGSIFFAGGGVRGGQVLGTTDEVGGYARTRTYAPADAVATIYRAMGIDPHATVFDAQGRPVPLQTAGAPLPIFG